ncbi:MAG: FAD-dependent oxidoreductase [Phycisphaerae bacterium]|nr:FAD-dependent oxidoreductase [Phycisphaerae bacterium]
MKTYQEPAREIPVARDVDVVVVGGGPAGAVAAIASARNSAKTVLVEQFGYLGGTATASLMACINGFRNQVEPDGLQIKGIAEEIVLELKKMDGLGKSPYPQKAYPTEPGKLEYSYAIDTEKFKYVVLKMCVDAGVDIMFHTFFGNVIVEDNVLKGVLVENKSGRQALVTHVVVDASGDADVAARAGVPYWQIYKDEAKRMHDSLMYRIEFGAKRPEGQYRCDFGTNSVVWGPGVGPINGADGDELSRGEIETRLKVFEDFKKKQEANPELADAKITETPPLLGIRQTRFIEGEYKLTLDDAVSGRRFDDVVSVSSCPIMHFYGYRRYLEHEGFDIPYRSLVPQKIDNLLVAGRCISSEQQPYESFRAMVPIMAIGQAAGTAAALSAKDKVSPRKLDVKGLQETLISQNVEIRK